LLPRTTVDDTAILKERQRADSLFREMQNARSQVDGTQVMAQQAQRQIRRSVADMGVRLRRVQQTASRSVVENTDSLQALITTLRAEVDTLVVAQADLTFELDSLDRALVAERNAVLVYRQTADSTVAAYRTALDASQLAANAPQKGCTVLGAPCPTRTQAMAVGVILGVLAGVLR
jgi:hypothetical protein